jgi:hypothetical protein
MKAFFIRYRSPFNIAGLIMTACGIILSFSIPKAGTYWGDNVTPMQEMFLTCRYVLGVGLTLAGAVLQIGFALTEKR